MCWVLTIPNSSKICSAIAITIARYHEETLVCSRLSDWWPIQIRVCSFLPHFKSSSRSSSARCSIAPASRAKRRARAALARASAGTLKATARRNGWCVLMRFISSACRSATGAWGFLLMHLQRSFREWYWLIWDYRYWWGQ